MDGVCVGWSDYPLRPDATLRFPASPGPCGPRRMVQALSVPLPGCYSPQVHKACVHNQVAALARRSLAPTPSLKEPAPLRSFYRSLSRKARKAFRGERWGLLHTAESYDGALRRRYLEAYRSLLAEPELTRDDWKLGVFVKADKFGFDKLAKPRMIFPRSPRYNLVLASWLKPLEHWLWPWLTARRVGGGGVGRVVAKGLGPVGRAELIRRKMDKFLDPVVFEVDGAAFEAHVVVEALRFEHGFYLSMYGDDPELASVLSRQLFNFGKSRDGVRFSRSGGRASGDFNTGMGNSLLMLGACVQSLKRLCCRRFDLLVDGDNALLFLERSEYARILPRFSEVVTRISAQELVLENPVSRFEHVVFGRSQPVSVGGGVSKMVRPWQRVLSGACASHHNLNHRGAWEGYLRGVALCESVLAAGVPVLWAWCSRLLALTRGARVAHDGAFRDYRVYGVSTSDGREPDPPTAEARESFAVAFGLSVSEQVCFERELLRLNMPASAVDCESPWTTGFDRSPPGLLDGWCMMV